MGEGTSGMFAPLRGGGKPARRVPKKTGWFPLVPVPENAPPAPGTHYKRGRPSAVYTYRGPDGRVWGYVCRFDTADGGKEFLPLTFCENRAAGTTEWRWKALPTPRPLYGLDLLASHPGAPVVVCEGEKAADAAGKLLPEWVAVTSPGGSLAAGKADWGVLAGRPVTVWRDADGPGMKYALAVARALGRIGAGRVALVTPPEGVASGWDAADALAEGWDKTRTLGLVDAARPASEVMQEAHGSGTRAASDGTALEDELQKGGASRRRSGPPQRDTVGGLIDDAELWHDPDGEAFVTLSLNGHVENWAVRSRMFKVWLCGRHYDVHGTAPGGQAVEDALRVVEARAIHRGSEYPTFLRVGKDDGAVYVDLGGPDWRAVKVTGADWEVVDRVPVKFVRSAHARPLPMPERGESVDRLRGLVNCGDSDFVLIVAWLVASLRPESPYPILIVGGEQGTAKSSLTRALRSLVDPNAAPIRTAPRDERDLLIAARNAWVLAYDNVSGVPEWFSNALCRLSTGGGMGVRQLFTDWEETVFSGERPVILNGIGDLASRPDLADRAVMVTLRPIPDDERRTEREWKKTFEEESPYILGALFDGVSAALRGLPETAVDRRPRMADFAQWMVAAEPGLGWEEGSFLPVYLANREEAVQASLEADPIAQAVLKMVEEDIAGHGRWEGSATELLPVLEDHVSENIKKSRFWPKTASMLSKRLTQAATILRAHGVEIERVKGGRDSRRTIIIRPKATGEG